ncbi:MAG: ATP-grasp domain-containing protein, partial [Roseococcus sp.]
LDNRPENPGHALAHVALDVDVRDVAGAASAMAAQCCDGVIAAASDVAVETAAALGERFGVVAPPLAAVEALLSKTAFRATQGRLCLAAPGWSRAGDAIPRPGPWIVKPVRGSGSRGVQIVTAEGLLDGALLWAAALSLDGQAMLEQFLPGSQHSAEGWMQGGRIAAMLVTDRLTAPAPHVATVGHRVPADLPYGAEAALQADLERLFCALDYTEGPFDADVVLTAQGPVLIEVSTRAGGNGLMRLVEAATGTDVMALIGLHALRLLPPLASWTVSPAGVQILSDPAGGRLRYDAAALPALVAEPWVCDLTLDLPAGSRVPPYTDGRARFGQAVWTAPRREGLEAGLAEIRARLRLSVE